MTVGILIHPFWSNMRHMENIYHNLDYDKLIVMLPIINKKHRDEFYNNYKEHIVNIMFRTYNNENAKTTLTVLETLNTNRFYKRMMLQTLIHIRNNLEPKLTVKELREYILTMDINYFKITSPILYYGGIYGDMVNFKRVRRSLKRFKKEMVKRNKDVVYLNIGGTSFIDYITTYGNVEYLFNKENKYEIFGEYYNKCVSDVKRILKEKFNIKPIPIKKYSLYGAFNKSGIITRRKQKKYGLYFSYENLNLKEL